MGRAALAAGSEERPLQAAIGPPGSRQATVLSESRELSRPVGPAAGRGCSHCDIGRFRRGLACMSYCCRYWSRVKL